MRGDAADGSLEALREGNRLRVVDALRRSGTASRSELAQLTGLSRTTVATLVGDLQSAGLVVGADDGDSVARPAAAAARPRSSGSIRPPASRSASTSATRHVRVAVADLSSARPRRSATLRSTSTTTPTRRSTRRRGSSTTSSREAGVERDRVVGAGMGLPGPYRPRPADGRLGDDPPGLGRPHRRPTSSRARIGVQVEVDNDANLGALGELTFGAGRGVSNGIYVKISTGIGAGLILGGALHRGATGIAGELGHVQVQADGAVVQLRRPRLPRDGRRRSGRCSRRCARRTGPISSSPG